jgi:hypothetical protein
MAFRVDSPKRHTYKQMFRLVEGYRHRFERHSSPNSRDVDGFSATVEANSHGIALVSGALTGDVAPMGAATARQRGVGYTILTARRFL